MLQDVYGEVTIEDLWRGFFSISSSLTLARPVVQRHGPLWSAVRASISMPIFLPPVHVEGELLIDGAYLNNMPTDVMRDLYGSGVLIAVNVNEAVEPAVESGYGPALSGWNVLRRRLGPRAQRAQLPSIPATILRTGSLHAANTLDASASLADLVITPPVGRFSGLDFGAYTQIIDAGYEAACRQIEQWQISRAGVPGLSPCHALPGRSCSSEPATRSRQASGSIPDNVASADRTGDQPARSVPARGHPL
jgi:predicted acylesterase/phospholipase RssA